MFTSVTKELWEGFLDLFFPGEKLCPLCREKPLQGSLFCPACLEGLILAPEDCGRCRTCGKWGPFAPGDSCRECWEHGRPFVMARGVGLYRGLLKEAIYAFKYTGRRTLARPLGQLMAREVIQEKAFGHLDLIVPVPLYPHKLRQRGFNQAALLAGEISKVLRIPWAEGVLARTRETVAQSQLSKAQRYRNLAGAFALQGRRRIRGKRVLLVDDILTTGQTAVECSRLLVEGGAARVTVVTLATGMIQE